MKKVKLKVKKVHLKKNKKRYFELFEEYLEEDSCKKAKNNFDEDYQVWDKYVDVDISPDFFKKVAARIEFPQNIGGALINAFKWEDTPESKNYWEAIYSELQTAISKGDIPSKHVNKRVTNDMVGPIIARYRKDKFSPIFLLNPALSRNAFTCEATILWHDDPEKVGQKDTLYYSRLEQLDYPVTIKFDK